MFTIKKKTPQVEQNVPGIIAIGYLDANSLPPNIMLQSIAGMNVSVNSEITWVKLSGEPTLTWEGSVANHGRQEKSTLKFRSSSIIPYYLELAFVVRCASGAEYIIGAREPRRPVIAYKDSTGQKTSDPAVREYSITHIAQKSVLPCVV